MAFAVNIEIAEWLEVNIVYRQKAEYYPSEWGYEYYEIMDLLLFYSLFA
jgi:hypothetical protein